MAEVAGTFTANIAPFKAAMGKMAASVKAAIAAASNSSQRIGGAMQKIGKTSTVAGVAIGAMSVSAIKSYGTFQESINKAAVIAGSSNKSLKGDMKDLEAEALSMGKTLPISAEDAGNAMIEMARNGASIKDLKTEFPAIAKASAVAGADLAGTATTVQQAMNIWGGGAKNAAKDSAILALNANMSNAEVEDMGQAFANVGSTAATLGIGIKDTSTAIGLMSNAGLGAAQGSQDLAHALTLMARPTDVAAGEMEKLGITYTDAQGKFKPFPQILKEVAKATDGMSKSQKVATLTNLYGAAGAKAMLPLLIQTENKTKSGKSGWDAYSDSLGKVSGSAKVANKYLSDNSANMTKNVGQALAQMEDAFDAVIKTSISSIAPQIQSVANALGNFATWINKSKGPMASFVKGLIAWSPVIAGVLVVFGLLTSGIGKLITNFNSIVGAAQKIGGGLKTVWGVMAANPIVALIVVIAALVAGLVYFFTQTKKGRAMWSSFVSFLSGLWTGIVSTAQAVWGGLSSFFTGLWNGIVTVSTTVWNTIVTFLSGLWNGIVTTAKTTWGILSSFFTGLWTAISTVATTVWTTIVTFITTLWTGIVTTATTIWTGLSTFFSSLWSGISSIISGAWELIKSIVLGAILIVLDLVTGNFTVLKSDISLIWNGIKSGLASIWNGIKSVAITVFNLMKNGIINVWNNIKLVTSSVWNGIKSFLSGLWNGIKHLAISTWNGLKSVISNIWNGIKSVTSLVWNGIKSFLSGLWNGIKSLASSAWNGLKSTISSAWNGIKSMTSSVWNGIKSFMSSAWNGIKSTASNAVHAMGSAIRSAWNGIKSFASNLWNGVKSTIQRAMHFDLGAAGRAIMDSFFNGLKAAWGKVKDFVGGIASWVRKHKGPISYDAKLLIPAGNAMMNGLNSGLMNSFSTVQHNVSGMADKLSESINSVAGDIKTGDLSMQAASYQGGSIDQNIDTNNWVKPTYIVHNELVGDKIRTIVSQGQADDQVSSKFFMS